MPTSIYDVPLAADRWNGKDAFSTFIVHPRVGQANCVSFAVPPLSKYTVIKNTCWGCEMLATVFECPGDEKVVREGRDV